MIKILQRRISEYAIAVVLYPLLADFVLIAMVD